MQRHLVWGKKLLKTLKKKSFNWSSANTARVCHSFRYPTSCFGTGVPAAMCRSIGNCSRKIAAILHMYTKVQEQVELQALPKK